MLHEIYSLIDVLFMSMATGNISDLLFQLVSNS